MFLLTVRALPLTVSPEMSAASAAEPSLRFQVIVSAVLLRAIAVWLAYTTGVTVSLPAVVVQSGL